MGWAWNSPLRCRGPARAASAAWRRFNLPRRASHDPSGGLARLENARLLAAAARRPGRSRYFAYVGAGSLHAHGAGAGRLQPRLAPGAPETAPYGAGACVPPVAPAILSGREGYAGQRLLLRTHGRR